MLGGHNDIDRKRKGIEKIKRKEKSAMLQLDNLETTDGERHRRCTALIKSLGGP
jgi:hypothetical protein